MLWLTGEALIARLALAAACGGWKQGCVSGGGARPRPGGGGRIGRQVSPGKGRPLAAGACRGAAALADRFGALPLASDVAVGPWHARRKAVRNASEWWG